MSRPHITVVNYYGILPVNNGGKLAIRDFYKALSEWFDITIVNLVGEIMKDEIMLNKHVKIVSLTIPDYFRELRKDLSKEYRTAVNCDPTHTMVLSRECGKSSDLVDRLMEISKESVIIITEHVYTYRLVKAVARNKIMWYRAQNVEFDYKTAVWSDYNLPAQVYNEVFELENECCANCDLILTITEQDAERFSEIYKVPLEKLLNISAGYDNENVRFVLPSERRKHTKDGKFSALYISSSASVAVEAAKEITEAARGFPNIVFNIAGSVGLKISKEGLPANVNVMGFVSDEEKFSLLETSDFALNPILAGSGLNIKMLEYFASGLPVICTEFGARGIAVADGINCILTDIRSLKDSMQRFCGLSITAKDDMALSAYRLYQSEYTWRACALKLLARLNECSLFKDLNENAVSSQELRLIRHKKQLPYIPDNDVYIYGAGEWGRQCHSFLSSFNIAPLAFLDSNPEKWGKYIQGVRIQSPEGVLSKKDNSTIIFALAEFVDAVKYMLSIGLTPQNVVIAPYGTNLFRLADGKGAVPYYYDFGRIQKAMGIV